LVFKNAPPSEPLALYFCDPKIITVEPTGLPDCQNHKVLEYFVNLDDCCLVHANIDSRTGHLPALKNGFYEEKGVAYWIDIEAVIGIEYHQDKESGACIQKLTGEGSSNPFWGWHTTPNENGLDSSLHTSVGMGPGGEWFYGPWLNIDPKCTESNMAFELLTNTGMPICKEKCCQCPPGPHWIDSCVAGVDRLKSGANLGIDVTLDCLVDTTLIMAGPAYVEKIGPLDDSVHYAGTRPIDGHLDVIDTEIFLMRLSGVGPTPSNNVLFAGFKHGLEPSYGYIAEDPVDPFVGQSLFDVFFRAELPGGMVVYNHKPHRMTDDITCVPPKGPYESDPACLPLYDRPFGDPAAVHVANLVTAIHVPITECLDDPDCPDSFCSPRHCDLTTFKCVDDPPPACDDNNDCTIDSCPPGAPACVNDALAANGMMCGSAADTDCDNPDTCLNGVCLGNLEPPGTPCNGGLDQGECDNPDSCDGLGACQSNHKLGPCMDDMNPCTDDVCAGGNCTHPIDDTNPCSDGFFCTFMDSCIGGICTGAGNPCLPGEICDEVNDICLPGTQGCCIENASGEFGCSNEDPVDCLAMGGLPQGVGTACTAVEACCVDGRCSMVDPLCCDEIGGDPIGPGSFCRPFGDISPKPDGDGFVDVGDILKTLDGFADPAAYPNADVVPCCTGDGNVDVGDILALLDAFSGNPGCPDLPCPCTP
jgi:hypothetical protein